MCRNQEEGEEEEGDEEDDGDEEEEDEAPRMLHVCTKHRCLTLIDDICHYRVKHYVMQNCVTQHFSRTVRSALICFDL